MLKLDIFLRKLQSLGCRPDYFGRIYKYYNFRWLCHTTSTTLDLCKDSHTPFEKNILKIFEVYPCDKPYAWKRTKARVGHFAKMPEFFSQNGTRALQGMCRIKDSIQAKTTRPRWPAVPLQHMFHQVG